MVHLPPVSWVCGLGITCLVLLPGCSKTVPALNSDRQQELVGGGQRGCFILQRGSIEKQMIRTDLTLSLDFLPNYLHHLKHVTIPQFPRLAFGHTVTYLLELQEV